MRWLICAGTASGGKTVNLGPLQIVAPTIGLAGTSFDKGILTMTIAIGANSAALDFGGGQGGSGITAKLTGILGTFDVKVDVKAAMHSLTDPAGLGAFRVLEWVVG